MSVVIGVQAAWRPTGTLARTLQSTREAGFTCPIHVFAEPRTDWFESDAIRHDHQFNLGCFPNWKYSLTWLLEHTDANWIGVIQDDIWWSVGAAKILEAGMLSFPRAGMLSPYTSPKMVPPGFRQEVRGNPYWSPAVFYDNAFVGAQALFLPRRSAQLLVEAPRFRDHSHSRKVDVVVGNTLRHDLDLPILMHVPSLASHDGQAWSTIGRHKMPGIQWGRKGLGFRPDVRDLHGCRTRLVCHGHQGSQAESGAEGNSILPQSGVGEEVSPPR